MNSTHSHVLHLRRAGFISMLSTACVMWAHAQSGIPEPVNEAINQFLVSQTISPSSPEAADFGKYGRFPVNYFQGGVNVSIPLHTYTCPSFSLPLSLEYQTTGLRVGQIEGWAGLGWNLVPGGMITRQVRGFPDQDDNYYFPEYDTEKPVGGSNLLLQEYQWMYRALRGEIEVQPDLYSYNIMGHSGEFYVDRSFIVRFKTVDSRIQITAHSGGNDIAYFTVYVDGLTIKFDAREETTTYQDPQGSQPGLVHVFRTYGSAWRPSSIKDAHNIYGATFEYSTLPGTSDFNHAPNAENITITEEGLCCGPSLPLYNYSGGLQSSLYPQTSEVKVLQSITFTAKDNILEHWQFHSGTYGDQLHSVEIRGSSFSGALGAQLKKYELVQQTAMTRRYLKNIVLFDANNTTGDIPDYVFEYHENFPAFDSESIDHWGYYNNGGPGLIPLFAISSIGLYVGQNADRRPGANTEGMLRKIIYPTGGYTEFEYEGNIDVNGDYIGGLRIRKMTDFKHGSEPIVKEYRYVTSDGSSSLIAFRGGAEMSYVKTTHFVNGFQGGCLDNCIPMVTSTISVLSHPDNQYKTSGYRYGYSRVVEDLGAYGSNVYYFDMDAEHSFLWSARTGELLKRESFDGYGNIVSKSEMHYDYQWQPDHKKSWHIEASPHQTNIDILCCDNNDCQWYYETSPCGSGCSSSECGKFKTRYTNLEYLIPSYIKKLEETSMTSYAYNYIDGSGIPAGELTMSHKYNYHPTNGSTLPISEEVYHNGTMIDMLEFGYNRGKVSKRSSLHSKEKDFEIVYSSEISFIPLQYKLHESAGWITHVQLGNHDELGMPQSVIRSDAELPEILTWHLGLLTERRSGDWIWNYDYDYNIRRITAMTDMNSQTVTFGYDGFQRLEEDASRNEMITGEYTYNYNIGGTTFSERDREVEVVSPYTFALDNRDRFDALGDLVAQHRRYFTPTGQDDIAAKVYDALGRVTEESSTQDGTTYYAYEPRPDGKVIRTYPPGFKEEWEHFKTVHGIEGDLYKTTTYNENDNITETYTDLLGRITLIDNEGAVTLFEYDDWGNVTKIIPPDCSENDPCIFAFSYHDKNFRQIASRSIPGLGTITYEYPQNPPYRLDAVHQPSGTITYDYNDHDQVTAIDGLNKEFEYYEDAGPKLGKLYKETLESLDGAFTIERVYDYDQYGRMHQMTVRNHIDGTDSYQYDYDILDNTRQLVHNHSGYTSHSITYAHKYDHGSRLLQTEVSLPYVGTHIIEKMDYDGRSRVKKLHQGVSGSDDALQTITYGYHSRGWLESIGNPGAVGRKIIYDHEEPPGSGGEVTPYGVLTWTAKLDDIIGLLCPKPVHVSVQQTIPEIGYDRTSRRTVNPHMTQSAVGPCDLNTLYQELMQMFIGYLQSTQQSYTINGCLLTWQTSQGLIVRFSFCPENPGINFIYNCDPRMDGDCPDREWITEQISWVLGEFVHHVLLQYLQSTQASGCCAYPLPLNPNAIIDAIIALIPDLHDETLPPSVVIPGSELFAIILNYDIANPDLRGPSDLAATARYNGDVAWMEWVAPMGGIQYYGFEYDELNRLLKANYSNTGIFDELENAYGTLYEYKDARGNIRRIHRRGLLDGNPTTLSYGTIDSIVFNYNNINQITTCWEYGGTSGYKKQGLGQYSYSSGNLTSDSQLGISLQYNILNLPDKVFFPDGSRIEISYDGDGNVLRKFITSNTDVLPNNEMTMQVDYVAGFMYVDEEFQSFSHSQGRVNKVVGGTRNEYFISDHLSNTRVVYSDLNQNGVIELDTLMENCELLEEYHYYPFGMEMEMWWSKQKDTITLNRYRYNGKEQQKELGWDWYNYGARYYDASVGRWNAVDPLAEKRSWVSPYNYVQNNPVTRIDPTGALDWKPDEVGDVIAEVDDNAQSLATNYGMNLQDAQTLISEQGLKLDGSGNVVAGQKLELDNKFTQATKSQVETPFGWEINGEISNCHGVSCSGEVVGGYMEGPDLNIDLEKGYKSVSPSEALPGQAIIRWGGENIFADGATNVTNHTAPYYGRSKDGTMYAATVNGVGAKLRVMKVNDITYQNNYGTIKGINPGDSGYYNPK